MSILLKISAHYPSMNGAERKVADALLKDPAGARFLSITQLATLAGVSQTTVNRFCRSLDFHGFIDFKRLLIEDLAARRNEEPDVHGDVKDDDTAEALMLKVLSVNIEAIQDTMSHVDAVVFARIVSVLAGARTIGIFGVGSSSPVAMDLSYRLLRSGLRCSYAFDSHMQAIQASLLGPEDVALAISHSGESQDTLDCLDLAATAGAATVGITSFSQSTLARLCGLCLMTSTKKNFWLSEAIPSRIAQLALCDALCVAVTRLKGVAHQTIADRIDAAVELKRS